MSRDCVTGIQGKLRFLSNMATDEEFTAQVDYCIERLGRTLAELGAKFPHSLAPFASLAEHLGSGLNIVMHYHTCTPRQARKILKHAEDRAFGKGVRSARTFSDL